MKQTHPLIYCVEDEDSIRGLISYVLNGQGFEVGTFESSGPFSGPPWKNAGLNLSCSTLCWKVKTVYPS